jgi:hypothetical protein
LPFSKKYSPSLLSIVTILFYITYTIFQLNIALKKYLSILIILILSSNINAQTPFKPNFQITANGSMSFPVVNDKETRNNHTFPGFQIELTYNISKHWGMNGNFSSDYLSTLVPIRDIENSHQLSGFLSARYYITYWKQETARIYVDIGIGVYSYSEGNTTTYTQSGSLFLPIVHAYSSVTQGGFNLGFGINKFLFHNLFLSSTVRYHDVLERSEVPQTITNTSSSGNVTTDKVAVKVEGRSYFQAALGVGFIF